MEWRETRNRGEKEFFREQEEDKLERIEERVEEERTKEKKKER